MAKLWINIGGAAAGVVVNVSNIKGWVTGPLRLLCRDRAWLVLAESRPSF